MKMIAEKQIEQRPPEEPYQKLRINAEDFGIFDWLCPYCEDVWCGHRIVLAAKDAEIENLKSTDWASLTQTMANQIAEKDREIAKLKAGLAAMAEAVSQDHKDAERYRKFRAHVNQSQNATFLGWSIDISYADDSIDFDNSIDALNEVQS